MLDSKRRSALNDAMADVVIVGGGVVGWAIAWDLAKRLPACRDGRFSGQLTMVDRPDPLAASRAAAGMLAPSFEASHPRASSKLPALLAQALEGWTDFVRDLGEAGITPSELDYRRNGIISLSAASPDADGPNVTLPDGRRGALVPHEGQVDPRRLLNALRRSAQARGVRQVTGTVTGVSRRDGRVNGVRIDNGQSVSGQVVIFASGYSAAEASFGLSSFPQLTPVLGRAVRLARPESFPDHVVRTPDVYICPKADGSLYCGATEEALQLLDMSVAAQEEALAAFWAACLTQFHYLADVEVLGRFVGIRPASPTGQPIVAASPDDEGVYWALGHDRNGVLLLPWTMGRVRDLLGLVR